VKSAWLKPINRLYNTGLKAGVSHKKNHSIWE